MANLLESFLNGISKLFRGGIDTSYDVKINYNGDFFACGMMVYFMEPSKIEMIMGRFIDCYNAEKDTVYLCPDTKEGETAISAAIACHEVGNAIAYKRGFTKKNYETEQEATRLALEYLKHENEEGFLWDEQYAVCERFLNEMLKSYK